MIRVIMFLMWCVFSYWQLINSRYLKHHYVLWVVAHSTLGSLILIFTIIGISLMGLKGIKGIFAFLIILLFLTLATTGIWNLTQKCSPKWSRRPFKTLQWIHRVTPCKLQISGWIVQVLGFFTCLIGMYLIEAGAPLT